MSMGDGGYVEITLAFAVPVDRSSLPCNLNERNPTPVDTLPRDEVVKLMFKSGGI